MKHWCLSLAGLMVVASLGQAFEFHVALTGNDAQRGTHTSPLRTIQRAAELAQPGDTITVHAGIYRERVNPPRGGLSDRKRIVYRAAPGELVEIRGSENITNWTKYQGDVWQVTLPNRFFGRFNPYADLIQGDWFDGKGREHHTGAVYLNGHWLTEAAKFEDVLQPKGTNALWYARVDKEQTTIWSQFKGVDPNQELVEINVRQTVFYPDHPGRNYLTVRGFIMRHAATPWAPPTAEQIGLIGTHWSRGWIIESNTISHSVCSGIALGKHGDVYDNTSANSAEGYVKTIERAQAHNISWTRENIGHHSVRHNDISHCEQAGIVGSLGAAFSVITDNSVHDIHVRRLFTGAEMAGIKIHAALDTLICRNHIFRTCRGLWLDWMAQGTRVSGNLFHENAYEDLFVEVNHGPFVVDNNIFLSPTSVLDMSQGGAFAHNLFTGKIVSTIELERQTPYHPAHATAIAGLSVIQGGDNRFYNNVFIGSGGSPGETPKKDDRHNRYSGYGLWVYDTRGFPLRTFGNVYYRRSQAYGRETNAVVCSEWDPGCQLEENAGRLRLRLKLGPELKQASTLPVTTTLMGLAKISDVPYLDANGLPLQIRTDYFGHRRHSAKPTPGPFETYEASGSQEINLDR